MKILVLKSFFFNCIVVSGKIQSTGLELSICKVINIITQITQTYLRERTGYTYMSQLLSFLWNCLFIYRMESSNKGQSVGRPLTPVEKLKSSPGKVKSSQSPSAPVKQPSPPPPARLEKSKCWRSVLKNSYNIQIPCLVL